MHFDRIEAAINRGWTARPRRTHFATWTLGRTAAGRVDKSGIVAIATDNCAIEAVASPRPNGPAYGRFARALPVQARHDCVARISAWPQPGLLVLLSREADVLRTPEFQHPVQCFHGNGNVGRSTPIGARS